MKSHTHPFLLLLSSTVMRSVFAGFIFVGMMIWIAVLLLASMYAESERVDYQDRKPEYWQGSIEIAVGPAYQGPWRMNDSEFHFVDDPSLDIAGDGSVALTWVHQSDKDIYFNWYDGDGLSFGEAVNVSSSPDIFSWLPRVAVSPTNDDHIFILWQEIIFSGGSHGGEILFARSTDRGRSFREPVNLSNTTAGAGKGRLTFLRWDNGSLDLAVDSDGNIYVVWTEYEGKLRISRSVDNGASFSDPVTVAGDDDTPACGPSLAVDPDGIVHLVWTVGEDQAGDIYYTRSVNDDRNAETLRFEDPRAIVETDGHSEAPKMVSDSQGHLHMVHAESPDGLFQKYHVYYSKMNPNIAESKNWGEAQQNRTQQSGGNINPANQSLLSGPVRISDPHPGNFESANYPDLALDAQDNLYVLWELFPDHRTRPQGLGFTASYNRGRSFTTPLQIPGTSETADGHNGSRQGLLMNKLAVSPNGDISVVNSTFSEGETSTIRLIRGRPNPD